MLSDRIALIVLVVFGLVTYLPSIGAVGWFSDDYALVYGLNRETPTFAESLRDGGKGEISVHRLLCYPLIGFAGQYLGPSLAHYTQLAAHLACGMLVYVLLRQLYFRRGPSLIAGSLFLASPLASQPIFWWSAVCTIVSTLCILLAAIAHVRYVVTRRRWLLIVSGGFAFTSLLFYELWIAGFVLLWGVAYGRVALRSRAGVVRDTLTALRCSLPLLAPYLLWAVMFKLNPPGEVHTPVVSLARAAVVFVSIHARTLQQIVLWPTSESVLAAVRHSSAAMIIAVCGVSGIISLLAFRATAGLHPSLTRQPRRSATRWQLLFSRLLVAWSVFLASRLVFILQGGIALHSRHSYGAAIAAAIVVALIAEAIFRLTRSTAMRSAVVASITLLLIIESLSAKGVAANYVAFSNAEKTVIPEITALLESREERDQCPFFLVGRPGEFQGEFGFFSEERGHWLRYLMQKSGETRNFLTANELADVANEIDAQRNCSEEGPLMLQWDGKSFSPAASSDDIGLIDRRDALR